MLRRTQVDFGDVIREWDGFGVNYVETSQTLHYDEEPQDYGGFSILSEDDRRKVIEMTFGEDGLQPGLVKMFLDPFHQEEPGAGYVMNAPHIELDAYDHERSTEWMRHFVRQGHRLTRERGGELEIIVTLYGPPAWMTKQRVVRGRDLDPDRRVECAKYIASFAMYLREVEGLPVRYVSLHNEGEDWMRWNEEGTRGRPGDDYNMYWPPEQVADFVSFMPALLSANGMADVGVSPGETSNWYRFVEWGYPAAIRRMPGAQAGIGLITSHGFYGPGFGRWSGDWRSSGIDMLREVRPDLHAWVTSTSWSAMDVNFVAELRESIYAAKVNGIIPWACIQRPSLWKGGDPNPGTAFRVSDEGELSVEPGYYWFKQACRAGQPGTGVARVVSNDSEVRLMAFADNGTGHGDAVVVVNIGDDARDIQLELAGTTAERFVAYRTSETEQWEDVGGFELKDGRILYTVPPHSATTFLAGED
ncbi:MAG: hypothetical protein R6X33_09810 [Candidatus Brocadiia bacterium]